MPHLPGNQRRPGALAAPGGGRARRRWPAGGGGHHRSGRPHSGLAISGFDPVAYFTDAEALPGKGEFEQAVDGAVWRFRSLGNRAAFKADPTVYMPRFGGYDPVGVARGVAVPGNPQLWAISDQRLYLFYSEQTRAEFADDTDRTATSADRVWQSVRLKLVP